MPEGPLAPELAIDQIVAVLMRVAPHERARVHEEASTRAGVRKKMPKALGLRRMR